MRRSTLWALPLAMAAFAGVQARQASSSTSLGELERQLEANADDLNAANAYRRGVIQSGEYDRAIQFFGRLVQLHPQAANAFLNFGFAYVDKIPSAGAISQVILANSALTNFSRAVELRPTWIGFYTRGVSYLFWPKIFGRVSLGIQDLERALQIQRAGPKRLYHVRTYIALGDGYWKADDSDRARRMWQEGLKDFPGDAALERRLRSDAAAVSLLVEQAFDPNKRVDTDLSALWSSQ